jgi:hypothetical protein
MSADDMTNDKGIRRTLSRPGHAPGSLIVTARHVASSVFPILPDAGLMRTKGDFSHTV